MPQRELRIFENYDELSRAAAARFVQLARERESAGRILSAAFSGGGTPRKFFQFLTEMAAEVNWARVQLFQVDERPVPPDHPQSNFRMIREVFLSHVPDALKNFHRMEAERADLESAARDYALEIGKALGVAEGQFPSLDLVFLGMGSDGHTASLFPHSPSLAEQVNWVRPNYVAKLDTNRVTLTYPVLNAAQEIIFLVSGAEKAEILKNVLEGPRQPDELPSQGIRPSRGTVFWYLDKAAASLLQQRAGAGS